MKLWTGNSVFELVRDKEHQDDVKKKAKGKEIVNRKVAMRSRLRTCYKPPNFIIGKCFRT